MAKNNKETSDNKKEKPKNEYKALKDLFQVKKIETAQHLSPARVEFFIKIFPTLLNIAYACQFLAIGFWLLSFYMVIDRAPPAVHLTLDTGVVYKIDGKFNSDFLDLYKANKKEGHPLDKVVSYGTYEKFEKHDNWINENFDYLFASLYQNAAPIAQNTQENPTNTGSASSNSVQAPVLNQPGIPNGNPAVSPNTPPTGTGK